ncbi:MAG TPA: general secretion pathway protein GspB [Steroidobacteraceae bacterium]|nr:general secretion pathway protein GspB [Steroidobacteraceae bacterium]
MSFILDALKKSEGERQRQSGPALFEVKVAPPRSRFPAWAIAIAALLAVNLGVVAWFALRDSPAAVANAQPAAADSAQPQPVAAVPRLQDAPPSDAASAPAAEPLAEEPTLAGDEPLDGELDPEDYALATEEEPPVPQGAGRVTRGTDLGVPTYEQLESAPGQSLPELHLDLHVFADRPQDRFIFLNNRRLREGEALPDGTRVESIVPDGAVLSRRGTRFLLQRQ